MQSELNRTENPNLLLPTAESQGEVTLTGHANDYEETSASGKKVLLKVNLELHEELVKDVKWLNAVKLTFVSYFSFFFLDLTPGTACLKTTDIVLHIHN